MLLFLSEDARFFDNDDRVPVVAAVVGLAVFFQLAGGGCGFAIFCRGGSCRRSVSTVDVCQARVYACGVVLF